MTVGGIEAVIFDLGGVITRHQLPAQKEELCALLGVGSDTRAFDAAYWGHRRDYDRGVIDVEAYWRRVAAACAAPDPTLAGGPRGERLLGSLVRADLESWFEVKPGMVELARQLRSRGQRLAILSNIHKEAADHLRASYAWLSLFEVVVCSFEHGVLKPERAIFDLCLGRLGLSADRTVFFDDLAENVAGAREAGLMGRLFVDEEGCRADLGALGLLG